jgi:Immunity protein Imm1
VRITLERRRGSALDEIDFPTTDAGVDDALARLNGVDATVVTFELGKRRLIIGGGPECYTVFVWLDDAEMYDMVGDPSRSDETQIILGGQLTHVLTRHCVIFDRARAAAREFLRSGSIKVTGSWEKQPRSSDRLPRPN